MQFATKTVNSLANWRSGLFSWLLAAHAKVRPVAKRRPARFDLARDPAWAALSTRLTYSNGCPGNHTPRHHLVADLAHQRGNRHTLPVGEGRAQAVTEQGVLQGSGIRPALSGRHD